MKPFNPFKQRRQANVEVTIKTCPDCHGSGNVNEEGENLFCTKCGGSGEITEKRTSNPNSFPRK